MSIDNRGSDDESMGSKSGIEEFSRLHRSSRSRIVSVTFAKAVSLFAVHGWSAQRANFCENDRRSDFSMSTQTVSSSSKNQRVLAKRESFDCDGAILLSSFNIIDDDFVFDDTDDWDIDLNDVENFSSRASDADDDVP